MDTKTRFAIAFVACVMLVGGMVFWSSSNPARTPTKKGLDDTEPRRTRSSSTSPAPDDDSRAERDDATRHANQNSMPDREPQRPETIGRTTAEAGERRTRGQAQTDVETLPTPNAFGGVESWDDPTNEQVLGPKDWMAPADDEERARIDEVFEKSRAARYDPRLSSQDRGQSVDAMRTVVNACFDGLAERIPGSSGRLIVAWTAGASSGEGRISNPRIKVNYKLEDEAFEACILDAAQNLPFAAADGEPIEVEAPFFFDGAF